MLYRVSFISAQQSKIGRTMFKKILSALIILGLCSALLAIIGFWATKSYLTHTAKNKANQIIEEALDKKPVPTADQEIITIARAVFDRFETKDPALDLGLRLRPYVSNQRLPDVLRFPEGVVETHVELGMCDNAARMLKFLLKQRGYDSIQWNMVTDSRAHSALLVYLPDGRRGLVDPFYGLAGYDQKQKTLLSPETVQNAMKNGTDIQSAFMIFGEKTETTFYEEFKTARMAPIGKNLNIAAKIPIVKDEPLILGKLNGNDLDVKSAASQNKMTPFWHYAGHKYDRSWVRQLTAQQNIRLEFTLVSDVESGIITSTPKPKISGRKMTWDLKAGEQITFRDGDAQVSLKRLNSYIGIDQISIYLLKQ